MSCGDLTPGATPGAGGPVGKPECHSRGRGRLQKSCPGRLCVGGGGDGQRSAEPKEGLDQGLDLIAA